MKHKNEDIEIKQDELKAVVDSAIDKFDKKYFLPFRDFLNYEHMVLKKEGIKKTNQADYVGLKRFLYTAINNLVEIDNNVKTTLFSKLKDDIDILYQNYDEFISKIKFAEIAYREQFLPTVSIFVEIDERLTKVMDDRKHYQTIESQTREQITKLEQEDKLDAQMTTELKKLKKQNADALHLLGISKEATDALYVKRKFVDNYISNRFIPFFKQNAETVRKDMLALINIKSFCLDQALWYFSERSQPIQRFFKTAMIQGNFSLKTYIKYYTKNLDPNSLTKDEEIKFLTKAMKDLD